MEIRLIKDNEFEVTCAMMEHSVRANFTPYYPASEIERVVEALSPERMRSRATWTHFYVAIHDSVIVGCGAIGAFWGSETESSLFNIFVDPEYQRKGIGRKIVETLEADEFALRAKRIQIPASIPAIPFYKKMGYDFRDDKMIFDEGHFELEKYTGR